MSISETNIYSGFAFNYVHRPSKNMLSSPYDSFEDDELCLDCFGPPPVFNLPPPPCSADFGSSDAQWSCSSAFGVWDDMPTSKQQVPIAAVVITAIIFVILVTVAAIITYRVRTSRRNNTKSPGEGAIIYDDLNSSSMNPLDMNVHRIPWTPLREPFPPRYSHPLSPQKINCRTGTRTSTRQHFQCDPVYHTISSLSGSGSDPSPCDPSMSSSNNSRKRYMPSDSDGEDSLTPFLTSEMIRSYDPTSPSEVKYYMSVPLNSMRPPSVSTLSSVHEYETLPLRASLRSQPCIVRDCELAKESPTLRHLPQELPPLPEFSKDLPPLPSRTDRYHMILSPDRGKCHPILPVDQQLCNMKPSSYL